MSGAKIFLHGAVVAVLSCFFVQFAGADITNPLEGESLNRDDYILYSLSYSHQSS